MQECYTAKIIKYRVSKTFHLSIKMALSQGRSRWSGWSGYGRAAILMVKQNFILQKASNKQKYQSDFGLVQLVLLQYSRDMMRQKIIGHLHMQNISCRTRYSIVQKLSNKQSAKVICRFDRQKSQMSIEQLSSTHTFNYIVFRVNPGLTSCEELATALPWLTIMQTSSSIDLQTVSIL